MLSSWLSLTWKFWEKAKKKFSVLFILFRCFWSSSHLAHFLHYVATWSLPVCPWAVQGPWLCVPICCCWGSSEPRAARLWLLALGTPSRAGAASTGAVFSPWAEPGCSSSAWLVQKQDTQWVLVRAENMLFWNEHLCPPGLFGAVCTLLVIVPFFFFFFKFSVLKWYLLLWKSI